MGHTWDTTLTIGKVFAGLNAQAKGRLSGIYAEPSSPSKKHGLGEEYWITVSERRIPMKDTVEGARAVVKDKPVDPKSIDKYLEKAFGESLAPARGAMEHLAQTFSPEDVGARAFGLYEQVQPQIASGQRGWGRKGKLDWGVIRGLASKE